MQTETTQIESFTHAGTFYDITDDGHGHITCSCPDYEKRRKDLGTTCKHMRGYLEDHYDVPDLVMRDGKPFVLNKKGKWVSWAQFMHLAHARASKAGEIKPAPAAQPVPAPAATVNGDAIAYLDALQQIEKLGALAEQLKRDITAGKSADFVIDMPVINTVLSFEKVGRGWRVKTIQKA